MLSMCLNRKQQEKKMNPHVCLQKNFSMPRSESTGYLALNSRHLWVVDLIILQFNLNNAEVFLLSVKLLN